MSKNEKLGKELEREFEKDSIVMTILKFSIPSAIASMISLLCVLTDRYFIGQVAGRSGMSAIAIIYPYIVLINGITFLFSGIGIITGIKLGEKKRRSAELYLGVTFFWILVFGVALIIILYIFDTTFLKLLGAMESNLDEAKAYTKYIIPSAIFQIILGQVALLRSIGKPKEAMTINIYTAVINIILDYLFVIRFGMGMGGAAFATLIATGITSCLFIRHMLKSDILKLRTSNMRPHVGILREVFAIGSPRLYNQILQGLAMIVTTKSAGHYGGEIATAAMGVLSMVRTTINTCMQGFNQGAVAIVSYYFGAKKFDKVKEVYRIQIKIIVISTVVLVLGMLILSEEIVRVFIKNDEELVQVASHGMVLHLGLMVFTALFLACNNILQAIKRNREATYYFVLRVLILNIGFVYLFGHFFKLTGVWLAFPIAETISGVLIYRFVNQEIREFK